MALFGQPSRATLRITSAVPGAELQFDAMLTLGRRRLRARCITAAVTPYEIELPDIDLSAVVRAHRDTDALVVEYTLERDGERRLYGRSLLPLAILERRARGILVSGMGGRPAEPLQA